MANGGFGQTTTDGDAYAFPTFGLLGPSMACLSLPWALGPSEAWLADSNDGHCGFGHAVIAVAFVPHTAS